MSDVKTVRTTLKLTQVEMALIMGVNVKTYRKWENGERKLTAAPKRLLEQIMKHYILGDFIKYFGTYLE